MKTNFSSQTVEGPVSFSFEDMAVMTDIFEIAAMEAVENNDIQKANRLRDIAERLGFSIDVEVPDFTPDLAGQDLDQTE